MREPTQCLCLMGRGASTLRSSDCNHVELCGARSFVPALKPHVCSHTVAAGSQRVLPSTPHRPGPENNLGTPSLVSGFLEHAMHMLGWDRPEARCTAADRPEPGLDRLPTQSFVEARPGRASTHDRAGTDVTGGPAHKIGPCQRLARGRGEDMARQPRELLLAFAALHGRPGSASTFWSDTSI